jgi:hypothetical protein
MFGSLLGKVFNLVPELRAPHPVFSAYLFIAYHSDLWSQPLFKDSIFTGERLNVTVV